MQTHEQRREQRLRRQARHLGFVVRKSRLDGTFIVIDLMTNCVIAPYIVNSDLSGCFSEEELETFLSE